MTDKKFSQFTNGSDVLNTDTLVGLRSGGNVKVNMAPIVKGPASSVSGHLAVFSGTTGKVIVDGGPVPSGDGWVTVIVTGGYQRVADKTKYIINSPGKVFFEIDSSELIGFSCEIYGNNNQNITSYELNSGIGTEMTVGTLTALGDALNYPILVPNNYTDAILIEVIQDIPNHTVQSIKVIPMQSAGLTLKLQSVVNSTFWSTVAPVYDTVTAGLLVLLDTSYTGALVKISRATDSAVAYVMPDLAGRASQLSMLDIGIRVCEFGLGADVRVIEFLDQTGGTPFVGGGLWINSLGDIETTSNGNCTVNLLGVSNFIQSKIYNDYAPSVFVVGEITSNNNTQSSFVTLYNPANSINDYDTPLGFVAFEQANPALTTIHTTRNGTLSVKASPGLNERVLLSTSFDFSNNNTLYVNNVAGTVVPTTSGIFNINRILLGARYTSGGITNTGYYKISGVMMFGGVDPTYFNAIYNWMNDNI